MLAIDQNCLEVLFLNARSQNGWIERAVDDNCLRAAYDVAKFGPTSMNTQPIRLLFLRSGEAKERLRPALSPGNVEKALTAPVIAVIAFDENFHETLHRTFPHKPNARLVFAGNTELIESTAFRNGTLQAAYLIIAIRAMGLDVAPMSGLDLLAVNEEFFSGSSYKVNFICGIGYGDAAKVFDRLPRLTFDDVAQLL